MNLLDLPAEILTNVLNELHWRDLLRCATTCKLFHETISSSSGLQYKIELGCAGLRDDCDCHICRSQSMPQRKRRLLELLNGWKEGSVRRPIDIPLAPWVFWTYELQGGTFARASMSPAAHSQQTTSEVEIVTLPSALHPRSWSVRRHRCDFEVHDFSFNVDEDVAALFQWPGDDPLDSVVHIHLKSLSGMVDHPEARCPIIHYDLRYTVRPIEWTVHTIQIAGDLLGCMFEPGAPTERSQVVFFNWRTGVPVGKLSATPTMGLDSVALISDRVFVVPDSRSMTIYVFSLNNTLVPDLIKSFDLPSLPWGGARMSRIVCRSDPAAAASAQSKTKASPSTRYSEPPANPHFGVVNESRVLCFILDVRTVRTEERVSLAYLFTPISTFLPSPSYTPELEAPVPWDDWIPTLTRAISMDELAINSFVTFVHGSRFVMVGERDDLSTEDLDGRHHWIHVFDFNQNALSRTLLDPARKPPVDFHSVNCYYRPVVSEPSTLSRDEFFEEDVHTGLLYSHISFMIHGYCDGLMVDGENIIALDQREDNEENVQLRVLQMGPADSPAVTCRV